MDEVVVITDLRARLQEVERENERLKTFAFGDAPEWEKANCTLKHRVRELKAELEQACEALREAMGGVRAVARSLTGDASDQRRLAKCADRIAIALASSSRVQDQEGGSDGA